VLRRRHPLLHRHQCRAARGAADALAVAHRACWRRAAAENVQPLNACRSPPTHPAPALPPARPNRRRRSGAAGSGERLLIVAGQAYKAGAEPVLERWRRRRRC
jgi:hypothetical protein